MPTATACFYDGKTIEVGKAIALKQRAKADNNVVPLFTCLECHERVSPKRGGGHVPSYFSHLNRNADCSLSHVARKRKRSDPLKADYSLEDPKALEGYEIDQQAIFLKRNKAQVAKCKERDKYTCRACGFKLESNGSHIIDCHHTKPLAVHGERMVPLSELVCLCPTCHRIAHTRKEPFTVDELKVIVAVIRSRLLAHS